MMQWRLNDQDYFETNGLSLLLFHDFYPIGRQGGIELIQHDERVITNGDVRLMNAPGQWDLMPETGERQISEDRQTVSISGAFPDVQYTLHIFPDGDWMRIVVDLDQPLPESYAGKAAFQFDLFPAAFFGKSFQFEEQHGIFPRQANGPVIQEPDGSITLTPLGSGQSFAAAAEDPQRWLRIKRNDGGSLSLYDGSMTGQHHWFVLRGELLPGKTTNAADLSLWANVIPDYVRSPVILTSQVGYHPEQEKKAWIELDPRDKINQMAQLVKLQADGNHVVVFEQKPVPWGKFLRYEYALFDFSQIKGPGMYQVVYGDQHTTSFRIGADIYQKDVWQPTLETYFPVQMCHMAVRDRYRVWHGVCHLDDALQAPTDHVHFDGYQQGPDTLTPYQPGEHIPHLDVGGWHDAGDFDLAAGSQASTTHMLALAREAFGVDSDQTTVDWRKREVHLHQPDGTPDIIQQIRHGTECLLGGYRASDHSFSGIIAGELIQYVHQGDAAAMTDNRVYDPTLDELQEEGNRSGKNDDRWVFTNYDSALEYKVAAALAAASRVIRAYYPELAEECQQTALRIWTDEQSHEPVVFRTAYHPHNPLLQSLGAAVELFIATHDTGYLDYITSHLDAIKENAPQIIWMIARILPAIKDQSFLSEFEQIVKQAREHLQTEGQKSPFGLPFYWHVWGVSWILQSMGVAFYYLHKAFPEIYEAELLYRVVHYVLGVHPGSSTSVISGVGAKSLTVAFGTNRADYSYIPGGGGSGPNLVRPDFPELKENFPFLWQQAEYVMSGAASYLFCVLAANSLLT